MLELRWHESLNEWGGERRREMNGFARAQRGETGGRCSLLAPHGISVNLDRRGGIGRLDVDVGDALGALTTCGYC